MQAVKGIYQNGRVTLLEKPTGIEQARVIVTLLDDDFYQANDNESLAGLTAIEKPAAESDE